MIKDKENRKFLALMLCVALVASLFTGFGGRKNLAAGIENAVDDSGNTTDSPITVTTGDNITVTTGDAITVATDSAIKISMDFTPAAGADVPAGADKVSVADSKEYKIHGLSWYNNEDNRLLKAGEKFDYDTAYRAEITLQANEGYVFPDKEELNVTFNDKEIKEDNKKLVNDKKELVVICYFDKTASKKVIQYVSLSGLYPKAGEKVPTEGEKIEIDGNKYYSVIGLSWYKNGGSKPTEDATFDYDTKYKVEITLKPDEGYYFFEDKENVLKVIFDGRDITKELQSGGAGEKKVDDATGNLKITYEFDKTVAKTEIDSVSLSGVTKPIAGKKAQSGDKIGVENEDYQKYQVTEAFWYRDSVTENNRLKEGESFAFETEYCIQVTLRGKSGYSFPEKTSNITVKLAGIEDNDVEKKEIVKSGDNLVITWKFTRTGFDSTKVRLVPSVVSMGKAGAAVSVAVTGAKYYSAVWAGNDGKKYSGKVYQGKLNTGINTWSCTIKDGAGTSCIRKVSVLGYQDEIKITLTSSLNQTKLCNALFGNTSGIKLGTLSTKSKKYLKVNNKKMSLQAVKYKKKVDLTMKNVTYNGNKIQKAVTVSVKMGFPQGTVTFKKKNRGKKITCDFSKNVEKLAKNKKKYGIKSVKVTIKFSKNKKTFQTAPKAVKRFFQPTVKKKERYVTSRTKFKVKRFRAWITYKTGSGTVKLPLTVKGSFK